MMMASTAQNLMYVYVGKEDMFFERFNHTIRDQDAELLQDGLRGEFFLINQDGANPFNISTNSKLVIPREIIDDIVKKENGVIHKKIGDMEYTFAHKNYTELQGIYVLVVPTSSYMSPIQEMARFTIITVLISILVSILMILVLVRSVTKPLSHLRKVMKEIRSGNLTTKINIRTSIPEIKSLVKSFTADGGTDNYDT